MKIKRIEADITTLNTDAIVNAANKRLLGGGGVDGFIHRAAGPKLYEACLALPEIEPGVRCPTGYVEATPAFDLPCKYVIHAVGPRWESSGLTSDFGEKDALVSCYEKALYKAQDLGLKSIAFPAISTGIYMFPVGLACGLAVKTIREFAQDNPESCLEEILLVTFKSPEVTECYRVLGIGE